MKRTFGDRVSSAVVYVVLMIWLVILTVIKGPGVVVAWYCDRIKERKTP